MNLDVDQASTEWRQFAQQPVDEEFLCSICHEVLDKPVALQDCDHHFCHDCITTHLAMTDECPVCKEPADLEDILPVSRPLSNFLNKQKVYCRFRERGCEQICALEHLAEHEAECEFTPFWCTNIGCTHNSSELCDSINRKDVEIHLATCERRIITCKRCEESFSADKSHSHKSECEYIKLKCEEGCGARIFRKDMNNHLENECVLSVGKCAVNGCDFNAIRGDAKKWELHDRDSALEHTRLLAKQLNVVLNELKFAKRQLESAKEETQSMKKKQKKTKEKLKNLKSRLASVEYITTFNNCAAMWVVDQIASKRANEAIVYSEEYGYRTPNPLHRYAFMLKIEFTTEEMRLYFILRRGSDPESLQWPLYFLPSLTLKSHINNYADRKVTYDRSHRMEIPSENNLECFDRNVFLSISAAQLDSGEFVMHDEVLVVVHFEV
eukprot:c9724_g1_i1.p1 GENE.c9724_g1_i1~~c9724_g1_i1.p1  ORF type:complete len:439 (+),score=91.69 c9724_g1_i1:413-1729(+)